MPSLFAVGIFALASLSTTSAYGTIGTGTGTGGYGTGTGVPSTSIAGPTAPYGNSTTAGPSPTSSGILYTTSTVYTTQVETTDGYTITRTIPLYTTVLCSPSEHPAPTETVTPIPPKYYTTTVYTTQVETAYGYTITRTIPLYTTVLCSTSEHPAPTATVIPIPPKYYTSTIYITDVYTITACPPTVTLCPIGQVTSTVYASTTICPYTETHVPVSSIPAYPPGPVDSTYIPTTTIYPTLSFSTVKGGNSTAPIGTGTGVLPPASTPYVPGGVLTTKVDTPPSVATYTPPVVFEGAAGKAGVSSLSALVMAGAFALLF